MAFKKIMQKTGWDELGDVDDLLDDGFLMSRNSNLPIGVTKKGPDDNSKQESVVVGSPCPEINTVNDEVTNSTSNKTRRRSAIIEDSEGVTEVKTVGYDSRNQRMIEQGNCSHVAGLTERDKSEFNRLLAKGVYLLGMREHSVQEMTDKLNARSDAVDVILAVVDELLENDYLSNERFAESYVRSRRNKGFGPIKIRVELKTKGISSRLINEHLQAGSPEWIDLAREQYKKKYRSEAKDYKEWTKRARFMQSRGFTMEHIQAVLPSADFY